MGEKLWSSLPFYPLSKYEPMYCVCDHGMEHEAEFCLKCPYRTEHQEAARQEFNERCASEGQA